VHADFAIFGASLLLKFTKSNLTTQQKKETNSHARRNYGGN